MRASAALRPNSELGWQLATLTREEDLAVLVERIGTAQSEADLLAP